MLEIPNSMNECLYFTRRKNEGGSIIAWTKRKLCPECSKVLMGKPLNKKGRAKIRSTEYVCYECGFTEDKKKHEDSLTMCIKYKCPHCSHSGETQIPYIKKTWKGIKSYIFVCEGCNEKIAITKKMKSKK